MLSCLAGARLRQDENSVGHVGRRGQRALNLGIRWQSLRIPPPPPPAGRSSSPTPPKCDSTLSMQHVLFTILVKKPQDLLPALLNLRVSILSGSRAGVASPSLGYPEFGSGTLVFAGTRHLNTLDILWRENIFFWVLHLPADPGCVASVQG